MAAPEQGDLGLLDDAAAAEKLLSLDAPARNRVGAMAPRWNMPCGSTGTGAVVMCSPSETAPKVKVLAGRTRSP